VKSSPSFWGNSKTSRTRKRAPSKPKIRWDVLGLQDPARTASTRSIEDIRSEVLSLASRGLRAGTRARSDAKDASRGSDAHQPAHGVVALPRNMGETGSRPCEHRPRRTPSEDQAKQPTPNAHARNRAS
jgi:hypothetical protein